MLVIKLLPVLFWHVFALNPPGYRALVTRCGGIVVECNNRGTKSNGIDPSFGVETYVEYGKK
jgi:hypothetical protein